MYTGIIPRLATMTPTNKPAVPPFDKLMTDVRKKIGHALTTLLLTPTRPISRSRVRGMVGL